MPKDYPYYWSEGQPKNIRFSYEDSLGGYLFIYKKLLRILEVVLENKKIVEPYEHLKHLYVWLLEYFYVIPMRKDFKHVPKIDFKKFASLINIDQNFSNEWLNQKPKYIDYLRILDAEFKATQYSFSDVKIPRNLSLMMSPLDDELKHHLDITSSTFLDDKKIINNFTLSFTAGKSHKKSIYKLLENNKNEWVDKKEILKKVDIKYDDFRSIISQLRNDIIKQELTNSLKIENNKKGRYKLTVLAS